MARPASAPQLPVPTAKSIAPPDLADSTLLDVSSSPQMSLGSVDIASHPDVVVSTADLPGGTSRELKADILRPATEARLPLVLFLPGGAFLRCNKAMAYDVRLSTSPHRDSSSRVSNTASSPTAAPTSIPSTTHGPPSSNSASRPTTSASTRARPLSGASRPAGTWRR